MPEIKYTKTELRYQRIKLAQLKKYLPTLQLKKAQLQSMVNEVRQEIIALQAEYHEKKLQVSSAASLASERLGLDLSQAASIKRIGTRIDNVAGVDIPIFEDVEFETFEYSLFSTPAWVDVFIDELRELATARAKVVVSKMKKEALERELREVSIRVNLFEKNLIPKAERNIRRIRVFLGDQELSAIAQAKVAKSKIEAKKRAA